MPVPPLPIELTRLILTFAAEDLPEPERRENCLRFAQVCQAWNVHAMELAWKEVSLWKADEKWTQLVDHLLTHTHLFRHVKTLDLRPPYRDGEWPRLKRILHLARPQILLIPSMGQDLAYLDALARPSSTSGLRMLHLAFLPASNRLAEDLVRILPKFVQLDSLEIVARPLDAYHGFAFDDPEHHAKRLSVRVLRLNVAPGPFSGGQALVPHWTRSLLQALEANSVQECILEVETGEFSSIDRLLSWTALTRLTIIVGEFGMKPLRNGLVQLCSVVSRLKLLKHLRVQPEDPCLAIRLSPVTLANFLYILPPSIQSVELDAHSFDNFDGIPIAGLEHLDTDAPRMRGLFRTERDFEEFMCVKIESASGELEWHVCAL